MDIPRPPVHTMTDFVVFCFVSIVVIILLMATVGLMLDAVLDPEGDRTALVNAIADIVTTLIGALVGFIAGKGQGRAEVHDEMAVLSQARHDEKAASKQAQYTPLPPPPP